MSLALALAFLFPSIQLCIVFLLNRQLLLSSISPSVHLFRIHSFNVNSYSSIHLLNSFKKLHQSMTINVVWLQPQPSSPPPPPLLPLPPFHLCQPYKVKARRIHPQQQAMLFAVNPLVFLRLHQQQQQQQPAPPALVAHHQCEFAEQN